MIQLVDLVSNLKTVICNLMSMLGLQSVNIDLSNMFLTS